MISDPSTHTPALLLARAEDLVTERRLVEIEALQVLLEWADVFSGDPQAEPGAVPVRRGGPKLVHPGGEGTPGISDLALDEIAIARCEGVGATRRALADAFDLRHRLPLVWARAQKLECETWVVRRVATLSRKLTREQVRIVDVAVAAALGQAPNRILAIAEAKIIEADTTTHQDRIEANQRQNGVWYSRPKPGDQIADVDNAAGVATAYARLDEADARIHEAFIEQLAVALAEHATPEEQDLGMDHWRAEAFAMSADPAAVLAFWESIDGTEVITTSGSAAEVVVHVATTDTGDLAPVARVEDLGPRTLTQVQALLARHTNVTVTPVIDLHTGRSVNGYEHPTDVKKRSEYRTLGDVFPHATTLFAPSKRSPDHDHTVAYDKDGPPGQTGDHNDTPLTRHSHRAKTHAGYEVHQLGPDRWIWRTPHGLHRLVTGEGTSTITPAEYSFLRCFRIELALAA